MKSLCQLARDGKITFLRAPFAADSDPDTHASGALLGTAQLANVEDGFLFF